MKIDHIVIHHSAVRVSANPNQFEAIDRGHKNRNWGDEKNVVYAEKSELGFYVQYHYFIETDGEVKAGRTEKEVGWHSGVWKINHSSIAICLAGNFDEDLPTKNQEESLKRLLAILKKNYPDAQIKYHRDFKNTHCPGNKIRDDWAKNLINNNNTNMIIKKENEPELYVPVGNKLIHFKTDWPTYAKDFERETIIEVSEIEFKKFEVIESVTINNKLNR